MFYLSLFTSFLLGKYANFLIDKLDLEIKYSKISKYLAYRLKAHKYYLSVLGIGTIIINLGVNIYAFI